MVCGCSCQYCVFIGNSGYRWSINTGLATGLDKAKACIAELESVKTVTACRRKELVDKVEQFQVECARLGVSTEKECYAGTWMCRVP